MREAVQQSHRLSPGRDVSAFMYHVRMKRRFHTLDVFTDTPLAGNPLAVVLDAVGLDTARMQAIAREFNLSETVFVFDSNDPVNTARVRHFSRPRRNLPFAGHPTIGTAVLIASLRAADMTGRELQIVLEEQVGPVRCTVRLAHTGAAHASFIVPRLPAQIGLAGSREALAAALSLAPFDIGFDSHEPGVWSAARRSVSCRSRASTRSRVRRPPRRWARVSARGAARFCTRAKPSIPDIRSMRACSVRESVSRRTPRQVRPRPPSRASPRNGSDPRTVFTNSSSNRGSKWGRPSLIFLGLDIEHGALVGATIGGRAIRVSEGTIEV